jgi:hypothetical protein
MALRQLPPLNKRQWDFVTRKLAQQPTPEQKRNIKKAVKIGKKIKTNYD